MPTQPKIRPTIAWSKLGISVLGLFLSVTCIYLLVSLLRSSIAYDVITNVLLSLAYIFLISIGFTMTLSLFSDKSIVKRAVKITLFPAELIVAAGYYYIIFTAPLYTFFFVAILPFTLWVSALYFGLITEVATKLVLYSVFVTATVAFVYVGQSIARTFLNWQFQHYDKRDLSFVDFGLTASGYVILFIPY